MTNTAAEILNDNFGSLSALIKAHSVDRPEHSAVLEGNRTLTYGAVDTLCDRVANSLQADGLKKGDVIAICARNSIEYVVLFLGALRAGLVIAPLSPFLTPEGILKQFDDSEAKLFFADSTVAHLMGTILERIPNLVALDDVPTKLNFYDWLAPPGSAPEAADIGPEDPFNIIYSSGTTGAPKGIVQPHGMRWSQIKRVTYPEYSVTLVSTPLYSNTTLVSLFPTLAVGGTVVLLTKFSAGEFLALSERHRVTHAMLVPVQYRRILEHSEFDKFDLSSFEMKFCTSAPFHAAQKEAVLARWPGGLVEYYGMTEGGATCALFAHMHCDKLHTVGTPLPGHEIRFISEDGDELAAGEVGEIVGRSPGMMLEYHKQPDKTADAEWYSPEGLRFIRTGDVGRVDEDGFVILLDRRKDVIISGGFNIYPSDLEAELLKHNDVVDAAAVGVPSSIWGETPVGFVALDPVSESSAELILEWVNSRLGRNQRFSEIRIVDRLPRSEIGKVLKRELAELYQLDHRAAP